MKVRNCWQCFSSLALGIIVPGVWASNSMLTVSVTVPAPVCIINGNQPVEVDFGQVLAHRVNGDNYRRQVNYSVSCPNDYKNAMKIQLDGKAAEFDPEVLDTSISGLGIRLFNGDGKLPVSSWLNFTYPNAPILYAAPVKQENATLVYGEFSAVAMMRVVYQ
ncbi:fimbrial protein [Serratia marcescens]|uniref:fimbrial protein n=1 Tax=Serratia marcescens TaxID=615 RepID=UPI00332D435A